MFSALCYIISSIKIYPPPPRTSVYDPRNFHLTDISVLMQVVYERIFSKSLYKYVFLSHLGLPLNELYSPCLKDAPCQIQFSFQSLLHVSEGVFFNFLKSYLTKALGHWHKMGQPPYLNNTETLFFKIVSDPSRLKSD